MAVAYELGALISGKYRLERTIGEGAMGVVVAARHVELDQQFAIKFLNSKHVENQAAVARFLQEARSAVRLRSEHVARVSDVGTTADGVPYMVMEYLEGRDLAQVLSDEGPLPVTLAVDLTLQCAMAVAEAHAVGIVHRDLKPANLFLTHGPDGLPLVKVLDFGISKAASDESTGDEEGRLTQTQTVMGSPLYMSPEQLRSARVVDRRSDIWAIGVILFELLSGEVPFAADTLPGLIAAVAADQPRGLGELRPEIPSELVAVIEKCLEKDMDRRPQDVGELARQLAPFASEAGRAAASRVARTTSWSPTSTSSAVLAPRGNGLPPIIVSTDGTGGARSLMGGRGTAASSMKMTQPQFGVTTDTLVPAAPSPPGWLSGAFGGNRWVWATSALLLGGALLWWSTRHLPSAADPRSATTTELSVSGSTTLGEQGRSDVEATADGEAPPSSVAVRAAAEEIVGAVAHPPVGSPAVAAKSSTPRGAGTLGAQEKGTDTSSTLPLPPRVDKRMAGAPAPEASSENPLYGRR